MANQSVIPDEYDDNEYSECTKAQLAGFTLAYTMALPFSLVLSVAGAGMTIVGMTLGGCAFGIYMAGSMFIGCEPE